MTIEKQLFDSLLEPIFILNNKGQIIYCNEPAALLSQQSQRKLVRSQSQLTDIMKFSEKIEYLNQLSTVTEPTPYKELSFTTVEGTEGKAQITTQKMGNNEEWIVFLRDVTLEERLQKKYRAELDAKEDVIEKLKKAQIELENYSKNLEKMVEERTLEIRELNQKLKALLDSLNQGFLIFDSSGSCWEVSSKACQTVIETDPAGMKIWDVLKVAPDKQEGFRKWMITLFGELLPFNDMADLGPKEFSHSQGKNIKLEYYPIRDFKNEISGVVLVATDITELIQAQKEAEKEKANSQFILKVVKQKKSFQTYFTESNRLFKEFLEATKLAPGFWNLDLVFRLLHTLKGGAASFSVKNVAEVAHHLESQVLQLQNSPDEFIREDWDIFEQKFIDEFKEFQNEAQSLLGSTPAQLNVEKVEMPKHQLTQIIDLLSMWSKTKGFSEDLKSEYLTESLQDTFSSYDYLIQSTAEQLGKKVAPIHYVNPTFRWSTEAYRPFLSTLVHVFRNAIDHGLESSEERQASGKPEAGKIEISARIQDHEVELIITDDGKGISKDAILRKMQQKGLNWANLTEQEILMQIFEPQFSTKDQVTDLSGRGVGLDAVKIEIEKLGGYLSLKTTEGFGTSFYFYLPTSAVQIAPIKQAA